MATNLYSAPKYIQVYAVCVNDEKPKFETEEWITNGKMYKVKYFTEPLNVTEGEAVTITDGAGNEIHPTPTHFSFKSDRFNFFEVFLN